MSEVDTQEIYHELIKREGSQEKAHLFLAARLRELANHIEKGHRPYVMTISPGLLRPALLPLRGADKDEFVSKTMETFAFCLSYPWGG